MNTKTKEGRVAPFVNRCDVLIVEDEPSYLVFIREMIRRRFPDLKIESAKDGIEGLKKAKAFKPRLVWTCVRLPRMDGLEMIELIRQDPDLNNPKVVVCTGCYTMADVRSDVIKLRVDRLFPKPFDIEEVLSAIEGYLS